MESSSENTGKGLREKAKNFFHTLKSLGTLPEQPIDVRSEGEKRKQREQLLEKQRKEELLRVKMKLAREILVQKKQEKLLKQRRTAPVAQAVSR